MIDPSKRELIDAIKLIKQMATTIALKDKTNVFIYFAGHGITINGNLHIVLPNTPQEEYIDLDHFCRLIAVQKNINLISFFDCGRKISKTLTNSENDDKKVPDILGHRHILYARPEGGKSLSSDDKLSPATK